MALDVVSAGSGDVTRVPHAVTQPLPLSDSSGTCSTSLHTLDDTIATYTIATYHITSPPGAVTNFVQIFAITVLVDCRPLMLFFSDRIVAKILLLYLSCFSVGIESEC